MNKFLSLLIAGLIICNTGNAQSKYPYWSAGLNPFSPGESMSSIGPCASYRLSPRIELWAEASFIFLNLYKLTDWDNLKGFRFIFQPRYYLGESKTFYIAPEFRLKHFSYNTSLNFINKVTVDTLKNYVHKETQVLVGGALVMGKQFLLSRHHNLFLDITAGVGGKQRYITRKNIPAGYAYEIEPGGFGLKPHSEWDNDGTVYFPLGFRLMWQFKN